MISIAGGGRCGSASAISANLASAASSALNWVEVKGTCYFSYLGSTLSIWLQRDSSAVIPQGTLPFSQPWAKQEKPPLADMWLSLSLRDKQGNEKAVHPTNLLKLATRLHKARIPAKASSEKSTTIVCPLGASSTNSTSTVPADSPTSRISLL